MLIDRQEHKKKKKEKEEVDVEVEVEVDVEGKSKNKRNERKYRKKRIREELDNGRDTDEMGRSQPEKYCINITRLCLDHWLLMVFLPCTHNH